MPKRPSDDALIAVEVALELLINAATAAAADVERGRESRAYNAKKVGQFSEVASWIEATRRAPEKRAERRLARTIKRLGLGS